MMQGSEQRRLSYFPFHLCCQVSVLMTRGHVLGRLLFGHFAFYDGAEIAMPLESRLACWMRLGTELSASVLKNR